MRFIAYGLTIDSEVLVPNLPTSGVEPDVTARFAPLTRPPGEPGSPRSYTRGNGELRIHWRNVGTFLIRGGREVLISPEPGVEDALIRLFLMGPVLAILLHQRGILVLHASVMEIGGQAVGFMGEKGWGKSTTAAALHARGHALVADDILAVIPDAAGVPMAQPGPPHFKLWPEAAKASFGDDPGSLAPLHSQIQKRERWANTGFLAEPLRLRQLYVLDRGNRLEAVPMAPASAMLALIRHTYLSAIMQSLDGQNENFQQCAQLAGRIRVSALKRPKDLGGLGKMARLIEKDVMACGQEPAMSPVLTAC